MHNKVAKCFKSDLRNSGFEVAKKLAGQYRCGEHPYKYLTSNQAIQVRSYRIMTYALNDADIRYLESLPKRSKKSKVKVPCTVTYRDDDGIHTASFDDVEDANNWIEFQKNSARYSGEIFEVI